MPNKATLRLAAWIAFSCLLGLAVLEAASNGLYYTEYDHLFYSRERLSLTGSVSATPAPPEFQVTPYLGFSRRPGADAFSTLDRDGLGTARALRMSAGGTSHSWTRVTANNFGYFSAVDYPVARDGSTLVGVFGGSLAQWLVTQSGDRLARKLAPYGQRVRVLNFAHSGHKQPQQLLALAYFLSLGQKFDIVLNIDGFNELALGSENLELGVDPSMPAARTIRSMSLDRLVPNRTADLEHLAATAKLRAKILRLQNRVRRARFASQHLIWTVRLRLARREYRALEGTATNHGIEVLRLAPPVQDRKGSNQARIIDDWLRSSSSMASLSAGAGARYFHVLQPNQYHEERTFSAAEAAYAIDKNSPYRQPVEQGYPQLRASGPELLSQGVAFIDATEVFLSETRPVYSDACCHLSQLGSDLLADFIGQSVLDQLNALPPDKTELSD